MFVQRIGSLTTGQYNQKSNCLNKDTAFGAKKIPKVITGFKVKSCEPPPPPKKLSFLERIENFFEGADSGDSMSSENINYP